jgi:hypothetical protein
MGQVTGKFRVKSSFTLLAGEVISRYRYKRSRQRKPRPCLIDDIALELIRGIRHPRHYVM